MPRDYWEVRATFIAAADLFTKAAGSTHQFEDDVTRKSANRACGRPPPPQPRGGRLPDQPGGVTEESNRRQMSPAPVRLTSLQRE